jgi:Flp pilus assembly pilin Flp
MRIRDQHGAASVEYAGLILLIALLVIGGVAALVAAPPT